MTHRRRPLSRASLVSLLVFVPSIGAALAACGSDEDSASGGTSDGGPGSYVLPDGAVITVLPDGAVITGTGSSDASGGNTGDATTSGGGVTDGGVTNLPDGAVITTTPDGGSDSGSDAGVIVQRDFPLATPGLGGYTLVDAFPHATALDVPAAIAFAKTDTANAHPILLERTGILRRLADDGTWDYPNPLIDFGAHVNVQGEGGAVGMTLHPKFGDGTGTHDFIYVWFNAVNTADSTQVGPFCTAVGGCTIYSQKLERFTYHDGTTAANGKPFADTETILIEQQEFQNIHNAGRMLFGKDGYLYFGNGDDGDDGSYGNHQTVTNQMFAGIFRIDVDMNTATSHAPPAHTQQAPHTGVFTRQNYLIPNDNPFVGVANGIEEFWALGFRNPYSWSFDMATGTQYLGDVGDSFREEVDLVTKGGNYGWPIMEGDLTNLDPDTHTYLAGTTPTAPLYDYSHASIADLSSIFGGFVYHGASLPELDGKYLYTDWITDHIWSLDLTQSPPVRKALIEDEYKYQPLGWGQDNAGEVYFLEADFDSADGTALAGGRVKKIARDTVYPSAPTTLSGTFLFKDVRNLVPADDLVPYTVSSPLWSDGAVKQRWVKMPASGAKISLISGTNTTMDGTFKYPVGTMFIKQFDMATNITETGRSRHLETRVMVVGTDTTYGYTLRWRADGSDADLVADQQDETLTDTASGTQVNWHYPSPGQCWGCHREGYEDEGNYQRNEKYRILGFTQEQLGATVTDLAAQGVFDSTVTPIAPLPAPSDTTQTIGARAYAYLAANCSECHHQNANYTGGGQTWIASWNAGTLTQRGMDLNANNYPMTVRLASVLGRPGLQGGKIVVPGQPDNSILLGRIETNDPDVRMPPIARNVVDPNGAAIIRAWIDAGAPNP